MHNKQQQGGTLRNIEKTKKSKTKEKWKINKKKENKRVESEVRKQEYV